MQSRYTWGLVLLLLGTLFLLNNLFDLELNLVRILLGIGLLSLGIILFRYKQIPWQQSNNNVVFGSAKTLVGGGPASASFATYFGEHAINLKQVDTAEKIIYVNCYFGSTRILIPADLQVRIHGQAGFAEIEFPNGEELNFGQREYEDSPNGMQLYLRCYFGEINCKRL